jgi:hypothetical protein
MLGFESNWTRESSSEKDKASSKKYSFLKSVYLFKKLFAMAFFQINDIS